MSVFARAAGWRSGVAGASGDDQPLDPAQFEPVTYLPTRPWAFLWHFVRRHYIGRYAVMMLCIVGAQGLETLEPYILKRLINSLTAGSGDTYYWFGLVVAIWFTAAMLYRGHQTIDIYSAPDLRKRVQAQMFGYLMGHSPRYFQDNFAGKLGQKVKEAGRACIGLLELITFDTTRILVMLVVALALLLYQDPMLAAALSAWMAGYLTVSGLLARRCVGLSKAFSAAVSTSTGRLVDAISNADTIRSFAKGRHERRFLDTFLEQERRRSMRLRGFMVLMRLFQSVGVLSMLSGMVYLVLPATIEGRTDLGEFTMVFTLASLISINVWNLSNRMLDFFEQTGTLTEAIELVTQPHEITDRPDAKPLVVSAGEVRFENIRFWHPDSAALFDGLELDIRAGEKVALVGPSGAGKSTLVKLLRRQYEPQAGRVLIDGQDIAHVTWDSVNEAIAEVSQSPGVFHRPVGENIRYGRLAAPDEAVRQASEQAHSHGFITRRPEGYGTIVGEQGIKLSGGEKQRVAIARALLKNAPILVLDEATSALDSESEHLIQQALWSLMQGRTVIAIAHRLSTITGMDRIVYLHDGRIVEQGSHSALLARDGAYARLWQRQVGGFLSAA